MATVIITVNTYEAPDIFLVSCGLLLVTTVVCWWFMWLAGLTGRPLCWDVTMSTASVMARCMILLDCAAWCILSCSLRRCKVKTSWLLWQQFCYILLRIKIDLGNQKRYRTCCNFAYFKHSVSKTKHDSKWCDNCRGSKKQGGLGWVAYWTNPDLHDYFTLLLFYYISHFAPFYSIVHQDKLSWSRQPNRLGNSAHWINKELINI